MWRTIELPDGIYQPPPWRLSVAIAVAGLLFASIIAFLIQVRLTMMQLLFYSAILSVPVVLNQIYFHKLWALGPPMVSIANGILVLARPSDSRGGVSIPLTDLQHLVVYGLATRRNYRMVNINGTYIEATPMWCAALDKSVTQFLMRALPDLVTVEEPQTMFAAVRGDGPSNER